MRKRRRSDSTGQVFRITGARQSLADDVGGRQRRYVISMLVRTLSVILAATLWNVQRPVAVVALVLGALLPYVAVVIANAGRENTPSLPSTFLAAPVRPMLTPPRADAASQPWEKPVEDPVRDPVGEPAPQAPQGAGDRE
ncbi:DUF3099 domain-containing protein [Streptomyces sp. MJP52]|uniref:DUF3099 domain-containing protein n=1 Tax=Streptomyces sp. MJP52 TaxID=2940555 RepID=UPI00247501F9|nr:DUF3099 domain-containing protein [Streptomyces sp. MJP52]MDH6227601.1 hypothetical protein [Streptomyces sp. MJP52]